MNRKKIDIPIYSGQLILMKCQKLTSLNAIYFLHSDDEEKIKETDGIVTFRFVTNDKTVEYYIAS
jgi:hypothetical protein